MEVVFATSLDHKGLNTHSGLNDIVALLSKTDYYVETFCRKILTFLSHAAVY